MGRRSKIGKYYVERRSDGTFKNWVSIKRSLAQDRRKKSKKKVRPGYGHEGDINFGFGFI
jgi:hypothetical protein